MYNYRYNTVGTEKVFLHKILLYNIVSDFLDNVVVVLLFMFFTIIYIVNYMIVILIMVKYFTHCHKIHELFLYKKVLVIFL